MKLLRPVLLLLFIALVFSCSDSGGLEGAEASGGAIRNGVVFITIQGTYDLNKLLPEEFEGQTVTWQSSNTVLVTVDTDGIAKAVGINVNVDSPVSSGYGTGAVTVTATAGEESHTIKVTATTEALVSIMDLEPIRKQFENYFRMGNIFNPNDVAGGRVINGRLTRHFNVLTAENNMKPGYISTGRNSNNFTTANSMVNSARSSGFRVVGHTLLWHSQNAGWMNSSVSLADMRRYITSVVTEFKGRVQYWDVLNEVFPDSGKSGDWKTAMRTNNPWFASIGSSFVYEGFLAARLADPNVILYYNDFNTDNSTKATNIADMVRDVNLQYQTNLSAIKAANPTVNLNRTNLLIEGIGMQEHHNTGVTAAAIRATLNKFSDLGVQVSVSELDVLAQSWGQYSASAPVTNRGLVDQARLYNEYMKVYLEYSSLIDHVSIWGVTDNQSWRSRGLPLLFDSSGKAKPAYFGFVGALN